MTRQRALVLKIIRGSDSHLSAEEIYTVAKKQLPSIVRATVYNNLNALCEQGIVRRIKLSGCPDRYDRNLINHEHLVCDRCGELSDISLGDLKADLRSRTGLDITGYELNIRYICPKCRGKN
jgi:Fe2+ or Zn2+ uptake regulation protein